MPPLTSWLSKKRFFGRVTSSAIGVISFSLEFNFFRGVILNRTLLLSRVVCGCARGAFPGDATRACGLHDGRPATLPFTCPYDDFLTPIASRLYDLRTYAFATHPRTRLPPPSSHQDASDMAALRADVASHVRVGDLRHHGGVDIDRRSARAFSSWCCPDDSSGVSTKYVVPGH